MQALSTIAPIILIVALGSMLRGLGMMTPAIVSGVNRLVFYVGVPPLLLAKIAATPLEMGPAIRVVTLAVGIMTGVIVLTALCCWLRGTTRAVGTAITQAGFRGNTVFIGLPIIIFVSEGLPDSAAVAQLATLSLAALVPFLNIASVFILSAASDTGGGGRLLKQLRTLAMNPLLWGSFAGLLVAVMGWQLPDVVDRTARSLGQMALPLALLGIGASLNWEPVRRHAGSALLIATIKIAICPLLGWYLAGWCGLSDSERFIAVVYLACPTAALAYIMAEQMGSDADLTAASIVLSTALSAIPLTLIVALGF